MAISSLPCSVNRLPLLCSFFTLCVCVCVCARMHLCTHLQYRKLRKLLPCMWLQAFHCVDPTWQCDVGRSWWFIRQYRCMLRLGWCDDSTQILSCWGRLGGPGDFRVCVCVGGGGGGGGLQSSLSPPPSSFLCVHYYSPLPPTPHPHPATSLPSFLLRPEGYYTVASKVDCSSLLCRMA